MRPAALLLSLICLLGAPSYAEEPRLLVVEFYADWCAVCRELEAPYQEVRARFANEPVLFLELDFTDEASTRQARLLASALGMDPLLEEFRGTGFLLLVDPARGDVTRLGVEQTAAEMIGAIEAALAPAAAG